MVLDNIDYRGKKLLGEEVDKLAAAEQVSKWIDVQFVNEHHDVRVRQQQVLS